METPNQSQDWADTLVEKIEDAVGIVRDKAVVPITTVARAIVYGLLAALVGTVVLVLLAITLVRIVDVYVPGEVWAAHAIVGGLFSIAGLLLWAKRSPKHS